MVSALFAPVINVLIRRFWKGTYLISTLVQLRTAFPPNPSPPGEDFYKRTSYLGCLHTKCLGLPLIGRTCYLCRQRERTFGSTGNLATRFREILYISCFFTKTGYISTPFLSQCTLPRCQREKKTIL